jgi:hypothetical protein
MSRLLFVSLILLAYTALFVDASSHLRVDPDTACSKAYRQDPSKDACLSTTDHFGRPCALCTQSGSSYCYNADEARWAKFFGASCEKGPAEPELVIE